MPNGYTRPSTPASVERQLRQEAGFGCARCGHPYIEYHHIVPYSKDAHFRPEDMVALCGNCHPLVAKWELDRQYEIKANPKNISNKQFFGALEFDKRDLVFKVGGNWYDHTPVILQFFDKPIIACSIKEGQAKVTLNLLDQAGKTLLGVVDNEISFRVDDLWDFEYAHNVAIARYGSGDIALRLDFRGPEALIEGKIWVGQRRATLSKEQTDLPGAGIFRGNRTSYCGVGIQIGDPNASQW